MGKIKAKKTCSFTHRQIICLEDTPMKCSLYTSFQFLKKKIWMGKMNLALCGFSSKNFLKRTTPTKFLVVAL